MTFRWLFLFSVVIVGCVTSLPADPSITADLAVETARMTIASRGGSLPPPPDSGRCENCNGTGKIGDGRIVMPCPECGGDGVKAVVHPTVFVPLAVEARP